MSPARDLPRARPRRRAPAPACASAGVRPGHASRGRRYRRPRCRGGCRSCGRCRELAGRALEVGRGLPDSSFLDRLVRSRTWIGCSACC